MKKIIVVISVILNCLVAVGQNVGIGTTNPLQRLDVAGGMHVQDKIGIGITNPQAQLHFSNLEENKKIILWQAINNQHQYYGFGINPGILRYQVENTMADHVFYAATGAVGSNELMRVRGNGNVGIGNAAPAYRLDVGGSSRVGGDFIITNADIGGTWLYLTNSSSVPANGWKFITSGTVNGVSPGTLLLYNNNNQSSLTVLQNGNIGLGANNPLVKLHVLSANANAAIVESSNTFGTSLNLRNTSAGFDDWSLTCTGVNNTAGSGNLLFGLSGGQTHTTMLGNGNLGIGITNPVQRLEVNGSMQLSGGRIYYSDRYFRMAAYLDNASQPNGICVIPHANNFGGLGGPGIYWDDAHITEIYYNDLFDVSDLRAKQNIQPLGNVLKKIQQLQPITFDINPNTHPGYKNARPGEIEVAKGTMGFTAQSIREVFPSMVIEDSKTGFYMIRNYHQLLSVLVQGMKEQQSIIELQNEKLRRFEERLQVVEKR